MGNKCLGTVGETGERVEEEKGKYINVTVEKKVGYLETVEKKTKEGSVKMIRLK